jgi:hypothetical protein
VSVASSAVGTISFRVGSRASWSLMKIEIVGDRVQITVSAIDLAQR